MFDRITRITLSTARGRGVLDPITVVRVSLKVTTLPIRTRIIGGDDHDVIDLDDDINKLYN